MHACMYVCMYTYTCMHACMHACMHTRMHACMYVCTYVCMYLLPPPGLSLQTLLFVSAVSNLARVTCTAGYTHAHNHTRAHTHAHTHVCVRARALNAVSNLTKTRTHVHAYTHMTVTLPLLSFFFLSLGHRAAATRSHWCANTPLNCTQCACSLSRSTLTALPPPLLLPPSSTAFTSASAAPGVSSRASSDAAARCWSSGSGCCRHVPSFLLPCAHTPAPPSPRPTGTPSLKMAAPMCRAMAHPAHAPARVRRRQEQRQERRERRRRRRGERGRCAQQRTDEALPRAFLVRLLVLAERRQQRRLLLLPPVAARARVSGAGFYAGRRAGGSRETRTAGSRRAARTHLDAGAPRFGGSEEQCGRNRQRRPPLPHC